MTDYIIELTVSEESLEMAHQLVEIAIMKKYRKKRGYGIRPFEWRDRP